MANTGIVWLATSAAEIAAARHALRGLTPAGVLDELGFQVMQGALSDRLYPAVTTIMTRARYLVFVPAMYRYLEDSGKARGRDADHLSRDRQLETCDALLESGQDGVIGKEARRDLVRVPSNIYWNALGKLGIAREGVSEASYLDRLRSGHHGPKIVRDDDKGAHVDDSEPFWDPHFPCSGILTREGKPAPGLTFRLTRSEARALYDRYSRIEPASQPTLFRHLVSLRREHPTVDLSEAWLPWDVPGLTPALAHAVEHSRLLSLLAFGATLHYHHILLTKRAEPITHVAKGFRLWCELAIPELRRWRMDEAFALLRELGGLRAGDEAFLQGWRDRIVGTGKGLEDREARDLIVLREKNMRGNKARLRSAFHLKQWRPWSTYATERPYLLGYRHAVGRVLAQDIADGLAERAR